jgi:hypothetical protein
MAKRQRRKERFHLLIYGRMGQRWAWPCVLIVLASTALWWFAPGIPILYAPLRRLALVPALVSLAILVYTSLARRMAWVQCKPDHVHIQTPFYPLAVSYGRIKIVHPQTFGQVFDPAREKGARQRWLRPYWGRTVLMMELTKYPLNRAWLRLWFSPYLLVPGVAGFVFLVEDWMGLSRQLDESRTAWEMRRAARRREARQRH